MLFNFVRNTYKILFEKIWVKKALGNFGASIILKRPLSKQSFKAQTRLLRVMTVEQFHEIVSTLISLWEYSRTTHGFLLRFEWGIYTPIQNCLALFDLNMLRTSHTPILHKLKSTWINIHKRSSFYSCHRQLSL